MAKFDEVLVLLLAARCCGTKWHKDAKVPNRDPPAYLYSKRRQMAFSILQSMKQRIDLSGCKVLYDKSDVVGQANCIFHQPGYIAELTLRQTIGVPFCPRAQIPAYLLHDFEPITQAVQTFVESHHPS